MNRRTLLQQALVNSQNVSNTALDSRNFGNGYAGLAGAIAQIATAGIGAYGQIKANKALAEQDAKNNETVSKLTGLPLDVVNLLDKQTKDAYVMQKYTQKTQIPNYSKTIETDQGFYGVSNTGQSIPILDSKGNILQPKQKEAKQVDTFARSNSLHDRFYKESKPFIEQKDAFKRIQASAESPSPAGDISLIFNFMKVLDPKINSKRK